jgi:hypothetical protein
VDAEQLGGAMTDKLAELFGEKEAKIAKAAAKEPAPAIQRSRRTRRGCHGGSRRKAHHIRRSRKGRRSGREAMACRGHRRRSCLAACASMPESGAMSDIDGHCRAYVSLVLEIDAHESGYVDAYFGPAEWRDAAKAIRANEAS